MVTPDELQNNGNTQGKYTGHVTLYRGARLREHGIFWPKIEIFLTKNQHFLTKNQNFLTKNQKFLREIEIFDKNEIFHRNNFGQKNRNLKFQNVGWKFLIKNFSLENFLYQKSKFGILLEHVPQIGTGPK